jgi:hypothetical protein
MFNCNPLKDFNKTMGRCSVKDRGKRFTQSTEQLITHQYWMNIRNYIYLSIMRNA